MTSFRAVFAAVALAGATPVVAQQIHVEVDGSPVVFPDVQPTMVRGRVMAPLRGVFEHMHAYVQWEEENRDVIATRNDDEVVLTIDSRKAIFNGSPAQLDVPAYITQGRTMVPLRFLSECLRSSVEWVADTHTVEIGANRALLLAPGTGIFKLRRVPATSVITFRLSNQIRSDATTTGTKFRAPIDSEGNAELPGLPAGSTLLGHVSLARPKRGDVPGVIMLAFDAVQMPEGKTYPLSGRLYDPEREDGRPPLLAFVGYGDSDGVLMAVGQDTAVAIRTAGRAKFGLPLPEAEDVVLRSGTHASLILTADLDCRVRIEGKGALPPKKNKRG